VLLVAGALLALLAVVSLATRSGIGGSSHAAPEGGLVDWAFSVFVVLLVLAIPMAAYAYAFTVREHLTGQRRRGFVPRVVRSLLGLAVLIGVGFLIVWLRRHHHLGSITGLHLPWGATATAGRHGAAARRQPTFEWPVAAAAGICVAAGLSAWFVTRRRRLVRAPLIGPAELSEDVVESIGDALDDLESEPDPRRAVVAAYARMETSLARHGMRRAPSETPLEYLRRVLLGLTARGDAVQSLTALFQEARYSRHEIDQEMKKTAISALAAIREDLRGAGA